MNGLLIICLIDRRNPRLCPTLAVDLNNDRPSMAPGGITLKQKIALTAYPLLLACSKNEENIRASWIFILGGKEASKQDVGA
jgi:hypothetical protein